jgi:signal transduction histidine kinase/CheY-like chemotaxis protein
LGARSVNRLEVVTQPLTERVAVRRAGPAWSDLTVSARAYVTTVILLGAVGLVIFIPRAYPSPLLFAVLVLCTCLTSSWKVNLPIPIVNGSTLSVSYAANLMALLLLGPQHAVIVALVGVWTQCAYRPRKRYPIYRTLFSGATAVVTMGTSGAVYVWLGGPVGQFESIELAKPLVGAISTYFIVNTGLVAGAIALSTNKSIIDTWRKDFLWLAASFMAAGTAGALAAVVVERGEHWKALLLMAPIYLTYRTYDLFVGRLEDHRRHITTMRELHDQTVAALGQARDAERALASEKERLTLALDEMTRLEEARKQLLVREHAARASAEEANRIKDQFLATVSHELRTPLCAILGWADMLRRGMIESHQRDHALSVIHTSARRQAQLIDDLLDVARIASGKVRLEKTSVNLEGIVLDALQVIRPTAEATGIRIEVDADPSMGPIHADGPRLQQIAWNLLSNAVKFTPRGGTIRVRIGRTAEAAEMAVSDTGQGISAEFLPAVFEAFRQADGSTTRAHRGLGIGLAIVKNLVEAHGGTVIAHSAGPGLGATFIVRLPFAAAESRRLEDAAGTADCSKPSTPLDGVSVLVVDDDDESREVVAASLRAARAGVLTASSAGQAFELLQRHRIDVLLADIGMPEEDGYSLIQRIRQSGSAAAGIPAAALTAFAREDDRQQVLNAGFQLHLPKPVDVASLLAAVSALNRLHLAQEGR